MNGMVSDDGRRAIQRLSILFEQKKYAQITVIHGTFEDLGLSTVWRMPTTQLVIMQRLSAMQKLYKIRIMKKRRRSCYGPSVTYRYDPSFGPYAREFVKR